MLGLSRIPAVIAIVAVVCALDATPARAEHQSSLGSGPSTNTMTGGSVGLGRGATAGSSGGGGGGGGAQYQKNETTKELAKAAEKYQKQIEESTKSAQQAMKEQTSSFLSSLDKLKVPDVGGDFAKQISSFTDAIAKSDNKASQTAVDEIIAATKANADTQVAYVKALAQRLAPNDGGNSAAPPPPQRGPSILERLQSFTASRAPGTGASDPLQLAMGAQPPGGAASAPPVLPNGATSRNPTGTGNSAGNGDLSVASHSGGGRVLSNPAARAAFSDTETKTLFDSVGTGARFAQSTPSGATPRRVRAMAASSDDGDEQSAMPQAPRKKSRAMKADRTPAGLLDLVR